MDLITKPDFMEARERWNAFWEDDVTGRPPVCAMVPKDGGRQIIDVWTPAYWNACSGNYNAQLDLLDRWVENTLFPGDLIPYFSPDFGPDQYAAWLGSQLKFNQDNRVTNWAEPVIDNWNDFLPLNIHEDNPFWKGILEYSALLKERGAGKYLVGMADLHSHMDAFSALRHPDKLCMDLYDYPEEVKRGCLMARDTYPFVSGKLHEAGGMSRESGYVGWLPLWCEGKTASVQCDFSVFLGNEMWREFVLPEIEAEAAYLDQCFYHLDGKQQLLHLDDLLSIRDIDGIQWVPGAGQPEMFSPVWRDVLKKILAAGKKIIIQGNLDLDAVKDVHRDLGSKGVAYDISGRTLDEMDAILKWLAKNT